MTGGSTTVYIFSGTKVIAESPPFDDVCVRQRCWGCPVLAFFARAGDEAADTTFVALQPGRTCLPGSRPLQSTQRTGHPLCSWHQRGQKPGPLDREKYNVL